MRLGPLGFAPLSGGGAREGWEGAAPRVGRGRSISGSRSAKVSLQRVSLICRRYGDCGWSVVVLGGKQGAIRGHYI